MKTLCFLIVGSLFIGSSLFAQTSSTKRIKVTEQIPITKPYTEKTQIGEQCYQDTIEVDVYCGGSKENTNSIGIDTIIGGIAGVAIGNQIGKGRGKQTAKILGGITGAATANQMRNYQGKTCKSYETVTRCNPKYEYRTINKSVGYNNCAFYNNEKICVQTKEPIQYIRIQQTYTIQPDY